MQAKNTTPSVEPPHYRGYLSVMIRGTAATYLDRGSRRAISVPLIKGYRLIALAVFVYAARDDVRVVLQDEDGNQRALRKIYIDSRFPYFRTRPGNGRYKSLNVRFGFQRFEKRQTITIEDQGAGNAFDICQIGPVAPQAAQAPLPQIAAEIAALEADPTARTPATLLRLDRALWALPDAQKGNDWRRAVITLYCLFQVNHRTAHKLLKDWVGEEKAAGRTDEAAAFQAQLREITLPNALGRHGFNPSFHHIDLQTVEKQLSDLLSDLQALGVQPFINSGTLLGYFRDGRPIPHDDDFDLGILVEGDTEEAVATQWKAFRRALAKSWVVIEKGSFLAVKLPAGIQVDLFAAWINDDQVYVHPYCWADVDKSALLPLDSLAIRDVHFPVPADPDRILAVNYGPNWRVPDPFWRFDYKTSKRRFRNMLKRLKA